MEKMTGLYRRGITWWFSYHPTPGRRVSISLKTDNLEEANAAAAAIKSAHAANCGTISDMREKFLHEKKSQGVYRRQSAEWAASPLKKLEAYAGNINASRLTADRIMAFATSLRNNGLKDTSVASYLRAIKSFTTWLANKGIVEPITFAIPAPVQCARKEFCTSDVRDNLINTAPTLTLKMVMMLGFHAGLRRNEIVEAKWDWINFQRNTLTVQQTETFATKSGRTRDIPLRKCLSEFLLEHRGESQSYIVEPDIVHGKSVYRYDFRIPFNQHTEDQQVPWVTPHTMRRTFASLLVSSGVSVYKVATWIGDSLEVTQTHYGHLIANDSDIDR